MLTWPTFICKIAVQEDLNLGVHFGGVGEADFAIQGVMLWVLLRNRIDTHIGGRVAFHA